MAAKKRAKRSSAQRSRAQPRRAQRSRAQPRAPTQLRALETVDAILAAARTLLLRNGVEGVTTNAIAKRAGVSIGSLYQYFVGRDAILEELSRRHVERALARIFAEVHALVHESLAVGTRRLIRLMIDVHLSDPEFHRILESTRPELGARAQLARVSDKINAMAIAYLQRHRAALVVSDLPRAAFVLLGSIEAVTHNAVLTRPDLLAGDALVDDLTRLVLGYLTGRGLPEGDGARRPGSPRTVR